MDRIVLDSHLPCGLYLVRSESETVFILRFRQPVEGHDGAGSAENPDDERPVLRDYARGQGDAEDEE
ncbi:MAG: hypothetical protein J0I14_10700 [Propionibacteriaceae bacterium]|nr:hypothetical protein [Propionibacteriaceae bacterium]